MIWPTRASTAVLGVAGEGQRSAATLLEVVEHGRPETVDVAELVLDRAPGRAGLLGHVVGGDRVRVAGRQALQRGGEHPRAGRVAAPVAAVLVGAGRHRRCTRTSSWKRCRPSSFCSRVARRPK